MSRGKNYVYALILYLLAMSGIGTFYYNVNVSRLVQSRFLSYYLWIFNIVLIICLAINLPIFFQSFELFPIESELIFFCIYAFRLTVLITLLNTMYCSLRWQLKFFELFDELFRMEKISEYLNCYAQKVEEPHLRRVLYVRIVIFGFKPIVTFLWALMGKRNQMFYLFTFLTSIFWGSLNLLYFTLIWLICNVSFKLHFNMDQLLLNPIQTSVKLQKVIRIRRMYDRLIRLISEICVLFKYPILLSMWYLIGHSCLFGYLLIRMCIVGSITELSPLMTIMIVSFTVNDLLEFLFLASISDKAGNVLEGIYAALNNPSTNGNLIERNVSINITLPSSDFTKFFFRSIGSPCN